MNVNFEPIIRGLKSDIFEVLNSVSYIQDSVAKEKKWGEKMSGNFAGSFDY